MCYSFSWIVAILPLFEIGSKWSQEHLLPWWYNIVMLLAKLAANVDGIGLSGCWRLMYQDLLLTLFVYCWSLSSTSLCYYLPRNCIAFYSWKELAILIDHRYSALSGYPWGATDFGWVFGLVSAPLYLTFHFAWSPSCLRIVVKICEIHSISKTYFLLSGLIYCFVLLLVRYQ